jgi:hypothetical protein
MSRSPSLALLYLATRLGVLPTETLFAAEAQFKVCYPNYIPGVGIWGHLHLHWQQYCAEGKQGRNADTTSGERGQGDDKRG